MASPRSAAPLRGSPQCAHWGKGSPESDAVQTEKDRTQCRPFFSLLAVSLPRRPLRRSAPAPPEGEAKGEASPFRGKYLEEGMGAPGRDMEQGLTL